MSSAFVATPFGGLPKQETFIVAGIFNTGFYEFDQNFVFLNLSDTLSIFDKEERDENLEIYLNNPMEADSFKDEIAFGIEAGSSYFITPNMLIFYRYSLGQQVPFFLSDSKRQPHLVFQEESIGEVLRTR